MDHPSFADDVKVVEQPPRAMDGLGTHARASGNDVRVGDVGYQDLEGV